MATIITLLTDIALGALAYRLAMQNRSAIKTLRADFEKLKEVVQRIQELWELPGN